MIGHMRGSPQLEKTIHKMFKDYNVHSEWYIYNYAMKEVIGCFKLNKERDIEVCDV